MDLLLSYNLSAEDIDEDFPALYEKRRRDSNFAAVLTVGRGQYIALRDHLGICPLFYRYKDDACLFSHHLDDLLEPDDTFNASGLSSYLAFGSASVSPLVNEIGVVPSGTVMRLDAHEKTTKVIYQYQFKPCDVSNLKTREAYATECRKLLKHAIERIVKVQQVGLLLSGGIDSAIIGFLLRELGIDINAYTIGAWGITSSEIPFAQRNAEFIGVQSHVIDYLETEDYTTALAAMPTYYKNPHGTRAALGVTMLWERTQISHERQILFGQNADTMTGTMSTQSIAYFLSMLPAFLRQRFNMASSNTVQSFWRL